MEIFSLTLQQMLMMFTLILAGYLLRRCKILPETSDTTLARLETYIFCPALSLFSQISQCRIENFIENSKIIIFGAVITFAMMIIAVPVSKLFVRNSKTSKDEYQRNVYKYSVAIANFAFMGNFLIRGVWGEEMLYKYVLFTFTLLLVCSSWGLYILIPKDENATLLKKIKTGLLAPPTIGLLLGMILGILNFKEVMPEFLLTALDNAGRCQGPVAMILAGFVIGGYKMKGLLSNKKVYVATALRLIVIPAVLMLVLKLFNVSEEIMILALIAFATPFGLNTIIYPAAYGGETETGASMAMVSHIFAVATIPIMYLVFIVLM